MKDDVGEKKGGKVDKHVGLFPFQVFGHATVLGAPEVLPVKTSIADPGGHYSLVGAAAGKPVDVPKFPAWFGYWVRGDKLSDKLDDGLQVGTFFGKTSKDKGTVFSAVGSLTFPQPFGTYITGRDSEEELINVAGWRTTGDVGFRIRVSAKLTPDSPVLCASPQAKSCQVGYVQNVNAASRDVRYLPNLDSKEFHPDLRNGTTLNVPDYIDSTLPFPTPLRDHKKDHDTYNDFLLQPPLNCGGSPFDIDDTPPSSALLTITKTFPPPPAIDPAPPFGLLLRYDLASHKRTLDFYGWCVIYVARGTGVVPLQQVRIGLTLDSSLDESKAIVLEDPAVAKNPPITDGETANAYARRVGYVEVLGDANTVVEKEP